jgi:hypothetical protein
MSRPTLADLKKRFKTEGTKKVFNRDMYPFWNANFDEKCVVRFLPDANKENPYMFYVEKMEHRLSINGEDKKMVCLATYGEKCPICELSRKYYSADDEDKGKYYYRKKVSLAKILVVKDPLPADEETEETFKGKVCTIQLSKQVMDRIKAEISNRFEDDDPLPWDFDEGTNFNIIKTKDGKYADYSLASGFDNKRTSLPEEIRDEIELVDLSTLLPQNPGLEKVQLFLDSHLTGGDFSDGDGDDDDDDEETSKTTSKVSKKKDDFFDDEDDDSTTVPAKSSGNDEDDEDDEILQQIRNRNRAK